ncbi:hypothetical protein ACE6H2_008064 [Prunus campanulata]
MMKRGAVVLFFLFSLALTQSFAASDAKAPAPPSPSKGKVATGEDCCKAIVEADDDCASTAFSQFNNHFFQMLLKQHCSNKGSAALAPPKAMPAPSPPKA